MKTREIKIGHVVIGGNNNLVLVAGPCVIESAEGCMDTARRVKAAAEEAGIPLIFKASFDKANRSSVKSFRGPGLKEGLEVLAAIKRELDVPILTDIHEPDQADPASEVADVLQIPAMLSRQTDLLVAAGQTCKPVNIKKGQFMAPGDMRNVIDKIKATDNDEIILTERGTCFGYHYLVNDMKALPSMRRLGYPVLYDATHSVQIPGGLGTRSGGDRQYVAPLARAAVAAGVDGVFMECHPDPDTAKSDGPNMLRTDELVPLLKLLVKIDKDVRPMVESEELDARPIRPATGNTMIQS